MSDVASIQLTAFSDSVIAAFHLISPDAAQISIVGPPGPQGPPGTGTIASTTNLLVGDGTGSADDSGIDPADVVQKQASFPTPDGINDVVACLQAAGLCAALAIAAVMFSISPTHATTFGEISRTTDVSTLWVPPARTVNGHALSANVSVTAGDLSLVIGTNVQAWDADLDTWATLTPSANFQTMVPHTFSQMRTDLGLVIGTNIEAWDTQLDSLAGLSYTSNALKVVRVNAGETAFELATLTGGGDALTTDPLSQFAATTSSQFKGVISDENAPDGALSKVIMALGSLSIASGKTATFSNTLALAGTDGSTLNIGAGGTLGSNAFTSTTYADNAFKTIAVSGQSDVVADSATDTLTLAAGSNVTITTNAGTDTVTIAATGGGGGTTSKVSGSDFTRTAQTLGDITGLTFAASANTKYEVDILLIVDSSSSAGVQVGVGFSAAGANGVLVVLGNIAGGAGTSGPAVNAASGSFVTYSGTFYSTICIKGTVVVGANAGNITTQILKVTSGTATVYIGSRMTVAQL